MDKTGVGTGANNYVYPPQGPTSAGPHAVQSIGGILGQFQYDVNGNQTGGNGRTISWTSFDMPLKISKDAANNSTFVYGPEHQRVKQVRGDGRMTIYAGTQEVENIGGQLTIKTYWPDGVGVEIDRQSNATELDWLHADRLGSPIAITDAAGGLKESMAYDAWGKPRNVDGSPTPAPIKEVTDNKGFTGHEMLDQLDLVHMNGRVFDPSTARFISGDPLVTDPTNGQSYNRYSYVLNNPTNLTDPTGFADEARDNDKNCDSKCQDGKKEQKQEAQNAKDKPATGDERDAASRAKAGWVIIFSAAWAALTENTHSDANGTAAANAKGGTVTNNGNKPANSGLNGIKGKPTPECSGESQCIEIQGKRKALPEFAGPSFFALTTFMGARRGVTLDDAVKRGEGFRHLTSPSIIGAAAIPLGAAGAGGVVVGTVDVYSASVADSGTLRTWQAIFGTLRALNKLVGDDAAAAQPMVPPAMSRSAIRENMADAKLIRDAIRSEKPIIAPRDPVSH